MDIKKKMLGKSFWIPAVVVGFGVFGLSLAYFAHTCRKDSEERLLKIANYMKIQCTTYTQYNEGAETQALLRAVESNRQVVKDINSNAEAGAGLTEEFLKSCSDELWLYGILVMDPDGNVVCRYAKNSSVERSLLDNYNRETVLDCNENDVRNYCQRIYLTNGGYINMAATARSDAEGVVISYYYISSETSNTYNLSLQSLMDGYQVSTEGTIMIVDSGKIAASNDTELLGKTAADNVIVQRLKDNADSRHITHIAEEKVYGLMLNQRDYYIYVYAPDSIIFSTMPLNVFSIMIFYILIVAVIAVMLTASERSHVRYEVEKEEEYKKNLMEAAKRADEANEAKTRFLQRMSHDIRTPINGICGMLEVAEYYRDDNDKQAECRAKIKDASHLLLELINEVLDMGKLESGEVEFDYQPFNLHEVLDEVTVVIEKLASEQGIVFRQENFDVSHWNLIGSAAHVKRMLMNIMSNSVKYNKKGGSITISCCEHKAADDGFTLIEFVCEDTGIGMSQSYQEKIFEPFTMENNNIQSRYGGTGLGMPITKGLVDKMNGTITFESQEGVGTTFVVTIPFQIDTAAEVKETSKESDQISIEGCKILLVEDNELNMEISEFVLITDGAIVTKAWNGQEAVDAFARSKPGDYDVILMDVMMPVMDGYQATEKIRAMKREDAATIPIIAMTANAFTEDRIKAREAGMNEHLAKPLDAGLVVETIAQYYSSGR